MPAVVVFLLGVVIGFVSLWAWCPVVAGLALSAALIRCAVMLDAPHAAKVAADDVESRASVAVASDAGDTVSVEPIEPKRLSLRDRLLRKKGIA